uniref:Uncharacterized protein n=1 Tax=Ditylum brightwellii TaxID=49249 RepID=A0A7S4R0Q1_9STRA
MLAPNLEIVLDDTDNNDDRHEEEEEEYIPMPGAERVDAEGNLQSDESDDDDPVDEEEVMPIAQLVNMEDDEEHESYGETPSSSLAGEVTNDQNVPGWLGGNVAIAVEASAMPEIYTEEEKSWCIELRKYRKWFICLIIGSIAVAVTVTIVATKTSSGERPIAESTFPPTTAPTSAKQGKFQKELFSDYEILLHSAQSSALSWLADVDNIPNLSNDRLKQRFALATLYYSTNGETAWKSQLNFLTDMHECEWNDGTSGTVLGVAFCDENGMVTELNFSKITSTLFHIWSNDLFL